MPTLRYGSQMQAFALTKRTPLKKERVERCFDILSLLRISLSPRLALRKFFDFYSWRVGKRLFIVRKMIFYPLIFLQSCNTIVRAERIRIKPISDYKMGCLLLALVKAFCQETFSKKTRANLACEFATFLSKKRKIASPASHR